MQNLVQQCSSVRGRFAGGCPLFHPHFRTPPRDTPAVHFARPPPLGQPRISLLSKLPVRVAVRSTLAMGASPSCVAEGHWPPRRACRPPACWERAHGVHDIPSNGVGGQRRGQGGHAAPTGTRRPTAVIPQGQMVTRGAGPPERSKSALSALSAPPPPPFRHPPGLIPPSHPADPPFLPGEGGQISWRQPSPCERPRRV